MPSLIKHHTFSNMMEHHGGGDDGPASAAGSTTSLYPLVDWLLLPLPFEGIVSHRRRLVPACIGAILLTIP
jgi:hypothetical protein